jgi:hypothetical protein
MEINAPGTGKEPSEDLKAALVLFGRGLGIVSAYGANHPAVDQIIDQVFVAFQQAMQRMPVLSLGTFNGKMAINDEPFIGKDAPIRALEKKLILLKISHLELKQHIPHYELKHLLLALCANKEQQMKDALASVELEYVKMTEVKYIALHEGETKIAKDAITGGYKEGEKYEVAGDKEKAGSNELSGMQVAQFAAFLKGSSTGEAVSPEVKKLLSDPEKFADMIMQLAAAGRSTASTNENEGERPPDESERLSKIVLGCLRRTQEGLSKESEFESARGKAALARTMLQLEKSVLARIRKSSGDKEADPDGRIQDSLREMETKRQIDVLSSQYTEQREKQTKAETKIVAFIKKHGIEKVREYLAASGMSFQEQQRLIMQSGGSLPINDEEDSNIITTALKRIEGLMQTTDPEQAHAALNEARSGINTYNSQMESRIEKLERELQQSLREKTPEQRVKLLLEISKLTLSLMQPLTVINGSIEAALATTNDAFRKDLLDMAYESGQSMDAMTKRMIALVGYPELSEADGHLNEWKETM